MHLFNKPQQLAKGMGYDGAGVIRCNSYLRLIIIIIISCTMCLSLHRGDVGKYVAHCKI